MAEVVHIATTAAVLAEAPETARLILRGAAAAVVASDTFGCPLPAAANTAMTSGTRAALWLGPDEWLLLMPPADAATVEPALHRALAGIAHGLVDMTHRQRGLVLQGANASRILSAGCPLDLRPAHFTVGMATRTVFHKVEITLWRTAPDTFRIEIGRSFAPYLIGQINLAAEDAATL